MKPPMHSSSRADEPRALPRERLPQSVWQMPAMWVCVGILFLLLLMLGRVYWSLRVGWREEAVGKTIHLYDYLRQGKSLQSAPPEWFANLSNLNSGYLDSQFGYVKGFEVIDHYESGEDQEEVVLNVNRLAKGWGQEYVVVDHLGRIYSIDRR